MKKSLKIIIILMFIFAITIILPICSVKAYYSVTGSAARSIAQAQLAILQSDKYFKKENIKSEQVRDRIHLMYLWQSYYFPISYNLQLIVAQCMEPDKHFRKEWVSSKEEVNQAVERVKQYWGYRGSVSGRAEPSASAAEGMADIELRIELYSLENRWDRTVIGSKKLKTIRLETKTLSKDVKNLIYGIYGIGNYYSSNIWEHLNLVKQDAIWRAIEVYEKAVKTGDIAPIHQETLFSDSLYKASKYFRDKWTEGTMKKDEVNLKGVDQTATVSVDNSDSKNTKYFVGPFFITYDYYIRRPGSADGADEAESLVSINDVPGNEKVAYRFSWIKEYKFYDQQKREIPNVRITDPTGQKTYKTIPRNIEFYLEFDYNEARKNKVSEINIDIEVEFFSGINSAEIIYYRQVEEKWHVTNFYGVLSNAEIIRSNTRFLYTRPQIVIPTVPPTIIPPAPVYGASATYEAYPFLAASKDPEHEYQDIINEPHSKMATKTEKITLKCLIDTGQMEIAGYVWDDSSILGKDQITNGSKDIGEKAMPGVIVTLYESNGMPASLVAGHFRDFNSDGAMLGKTLSTNPTITDDNGYYSFKGVDASKKYYVKFTYNGMDYEATTTKSQVTVENDYNTIKWNNASKGSEITGDRNYLNEKFVTVGSTPNSYATTQALSGDYLSKEKDGKTYNKVYVASDLESIKNEIYKKGISSLAMNLAVSSPELFMKAVYQGVASEHGNDPETLRKLQFIYDCRINAYAGYNSEDGGTLLTHKKEYYPVYEKFTLTRNVPSILGNRLEAYAPKCENGYWYIYVGQLNIGMGLIPRQTTILNLREDLYQTVVSLNGKDETYKYGTLSDKELDLSATDYFAKTVSSTILGDYNQVIAPEDYNYNTDQSQLNNGVATYEDEYAKIQVYATYKISVKNMSLIPTTVNELVTYFDRMYFSYSDLPIGNAYRTTEGKEIASIMAFRNTIEPLLDVKTTSHSRYGENSETMSLLGIAAGLATGHDYTDLYINLGENGVMLETGDSITVYITYRMGENSIKDLKYNCTYGLWHGTDNSAQTIFKNTLGNNQQIRIETITEVNGFSTFYNQVSDVLTPGKLLKMTVTGAYKYSYYGKTYRAAGVMDTYSVPGNLDAGQLLQVLVKEKDWDRAPTLVFGSPDDRRTISGKVWETEDDANKYINNSKYPELDEERLIEGITVQLVELTGNNEQKVRAITQTNENGEYLFKGYIPGDYAIRFVYGDRARFDDRQYSNNRTYTMNGQTYKCAYNGQFYQSAKANPNTNETQFWYNENENTAMRYSDAYDEVNIRMKVNTAFNDDPENLSNSTYKNGYVYEDIVDLTKHPNKYMVYAYTSLLDIYPEKAKTETSGSNQSPTYPISNIDFALTPRTETKLNITKEVKNIKLILQNGTVQFDATPETIREQGVPAVVQAARGYDINIQMSNELINGSTIEITYEITAKNNSEYDSVTYYKDAGGNIIALGLYEEDYTTLVYHENENSLRTYTPAEPDHITNIIDNPANGKKYEENISYINAGTTELREYATTKIVETTTTPALVADYVSTNLNFSQIDYSGRIINEGWELSTLTQDEFSRKYHGQNENEIETYLPKMENLNSEEVYNVNKIIVSTKENPLVSTKLKPGEVVSADIVLSKVISVENDSTDNKSYNNSVRIVQTNNTVSRIQEVNSTEEEIRLKHVSENVIISDPTGADRSYKLVTIILISIAIIAFGIVIIKKFVLNNK